MWSVVRVPSHEAEDFRQLTRDYNTLGKELRTHRMRIQSLLVTQGISVKVTAKLRHSLDKLVTRDGMPLPRYLLERLHREFERLELVSRQRLELNKQRQAVVTAMEDAPAEKIARLCQLRGIADKGAWVLVSELLGWRRFDNAKQVGACAGLAPTPYNSGAALREQGISKTGNPTVRSMMVQLAWCWLRYQPGSSLSRWFEERFSLGSRQRRKGIVALARKLLVALWRFLERGVVPEGAQMKALTA